MWKKKNAATTVEEVVAENVKPFGGLKAFLKDKEHSLPNVKEASLMIWDAIKKKTPIRIIGDYDVDGLCASSIMYIFIASLGGEVKVRIPRRLSEGYGLNEIIINEISNEIGPNPCLIITVDNGILAFSAIKKAKEKGYTVLLTDHHLPNYDENGKEILPDADLIVNPHLKSGAVYDFEHYCGAAIAYKIAEAYMGQNEMAEKLLTYAAIATIADVVPLYDENRTIVKRGLNFLNDENTFPGLHHLVRNLWLTGVVNEDDVAFKIGPMLNAPGRLVDTGGVKVMGLLGFAEPNSEREEKLIAAITEINEKRKELTNNFATVMIQEAGTNPAAPIVQVTKAPQGILGPLASKLVEEFNVPALVLTEDEATGLLKGSGRSVDNVHLFHLLNKHRDLFVKLGGHAGATGFALKKENLKELTKVLQEDLAGTSFDKDSYYDLEIDESDVEKIKEEEKKFRPFGEGNPSPVVLIKNVSVDPETFSEIKAKHFKIRRKDYAVMGFYQLDKYRAMGSPQKIDIVGTIGPSYFNGEEQTTFTLTDFWATKTEDEILSLRERLEKEEMI